MGDTHLCCYHPFVVHSDLLDELYTNPCSHKESDPSEPKENSGCDGENACAGHVECLGFHNIHLAGWREVRSQVRVAFHLYTSHIVHGIGPCQGSSTAWCPWLTKAPWGTTSHGGKEAKISLTLSSGDESTALGFVIRCREKHVGCLPSYRIPASRP